jgi:hypothetical protein
MDYFTLYESLQVSHGLYSKINANYLLPLHHQCNFVNTVISNHDFSSVTGTAKLPGVARLLMKLLNVDAFKPNDAESRRLVDYAC